MKSSAIRAGFPVLKAPAALPTVEGDQTSPLQPRKPSSTKGRVFRRRSHSIKVTAKKVGKISAVLRRRHTAAKQTRQAAINDNWEFVRRIASAAMIVNSLKKSTTKSEKIMHSSGIPDYDNFLQTIGIPKEKRTESHVQKLARMMSNLSFFKGLHMKIKLIRELSRTAVVSNLKTGNTIILDGELTSNRYIYIILVGSVQVYMRHPQNPKLSVKLSQKRQGDHFGASKTPSSEEAYVQANEHCSLLVLENHVMEDLLHTDRLAKARSIAKFLSQVPAFKQISAKEIEDVSFATSRVVYRPGEFIYKEGDIVNQKYFFIVIKRGQIDAYRRVSFVKKRRHKAAKTIAGKGDIVANAALRCVASHHPNDIITCRRKIPDKVLQGENYKYKDIRAMQNEVTVRAKTICECFAIPQTALYKRLTTTSLNSLAEHMPLYPQKAVIEKQILNRNIWDNYKKQLINDILLQSTRNGVKLIRNNCAVSSRTNRAFRSHQDSQTEKAAIAKRRLQSS